VQSRTGGIVDDHAEDDAPQWLSTAEASKRLGISVHRLYGLIDRGGLPAYKFGRVIRLRADEVEDAADAAPD
jgi:excisionase family DNA binding protein